VSDPLERFRPATRAWFDGVFEAPTPAQAGAWQAVADGRHSLVVAPTGSGKTLAAFLWAIDRLMGEPTPTQRSRRTRVLYVSPLKALAVDVERNLRAPLTGITAAAERLGDPVTPLRVGIRSGDTPPQERRSLVSRPPDILITTPESLYLLLTSRAREGLAGVTTVIVDEVHAVAGTKRGAHLSLSLERLDALLDSPAQRIGLSATVRPTERVAQFLGGTHPVDVVQPGQRKPLDLTVVVPVEDLTELDAEVAAGGEAGSGRATPSLWPHVESRILDLVQAHRSTIVFTNSRRLSERLAARLNEIWHERQSGRSLEEPGAQQPAQLMAQAGSTRGHDPATDIARAHHGSVSREQRQRIEEDLKAGRLPAVVATSSLELGIDMGSVDLVVQVEAPPSVASGLQRIGRAEHRVDGVSRGVVFPKHRGELVPTAVTVERMRAGTIEALQVPRNPLDVLAQQVVAMVSMDDWTVAELGALVRRAAPFHELPDSALESVLDMLAGRYPSDAFAELRPRLVWDRDGDVLRARPGTHRLAVVNGGTIPDRGLYGVFLASAAQEGRPGGRRVGELDEEMVYESRVGDVFALGSSSWRIEDITHDRVLVSPAPGQPGRLPFWHGDIVGRPAELGRAIGAFVREVARDPAADARIQAAGLDAWAADNLRAYLGEQQQATGQLPDDRTIVVERFRDEIGDWRFAVHSPFGGRVHTPWSLALAARMRDDLGLDVQVMPSDDGIVLRLPDMDLPEDDTVSVAQRLLFDPDDVERAVTEAVAGSALFAARFRECAARSLLLPRRRPDRRTPLWQQRQRAAQLLGVASEHASFPIVLETMRECLQDVFDVPGLRGLMADIDSGAVRVLEVATDQPSPFARSLLFSYVGAFLYEGDAPLAERRAQALALDTTLLAELLGQAELRDLLDPEALAQVEAELQWLTPERRLRDAEGVADLLRVLGPLTEAELAERGGQPSWAEELASQRRAVLVRLAGEPRWAAAEDVGRLRDAAGVPPPPGLADAFLEPVADPVADLVSRYARTHGPFTAEHAAGALGLGGAVVTGALNRLQSGGRVRCGQFRPGGAGTEWVDTQVLRQLRRRSLAVLRREVEPVDQAQLGRFLPEWQGVGARRAGPGALLDVVEQLQGAPVPASVLERQLLPSRVRDYQPAMLDALTSAGEVLWSGRGSLPSGDGWVSVHLTADAPLLLPEPAADAVATEVHEQVLAALDGGAARFWSDLAARLDPQPAGEVLAAALWDLVWSGHLTNDTLGPVRAMVAGPARRPGRYHRPRARGGGRPAADPTLLGRWWQLPRPEPDPTRRGHAVAETLLRRHGVLTRGAVPAERVTGGFAGVYRVLTAMADVGHARRGYFVEGLGASQFAADGAVDRLRSLPHPGATSAVVLAATDPANPYGAALPWPSRPDGAGSHRPGRKAGAVVVLVDGRLVLYVERGGRSLLSWTHELAPEPDGGQPAGDALTAAVAALAAAVREGWLGKMTVQRTDGEPAFASPLGVALEQAGFRATPRGLRLRP
jgi:ATP-dependent Lhr-like helicase